MDYQRIDLRQSMDIPASGVATRVLFEDEHVKLVALAVGAGSEPGDHAAPFNVAIQVIVGEARFKLIDGEEFPLAQGAWIYVPNGRRHRVNAITPLLLTLTMIKSAKVAK